MQQRSALPWLMIVGGGAVAAYFAFGKKASAETSPVDTVKDKGKEKYAPVRWVAGLQNGWISPGDLEAALVRAENRGNPLTVQFFVKAAPPYEKIPVHALYGNLIHYGKDGEGRFLDVAIEDSFFGGFSEGVEYKSSPKGTVYRLRPDHVNQLTTNESVAAVPFTASWPFAGNKTPVNLTDPIERLSIARRYDPALWSTYLLPNKKPVTISTFKAAEMMARKDQPLYIKSAVRLTATPSIKGPFVAEVLRTYLDASAPYVLAYVTLGPVLTSVPGFINPDSVYHEILYVPLSHIYEVSTSSNMVISADESKNA